MAALDVARNYFYAWNARDFAASIATLFQTATIPVIP